MGAGDWEQCGWGLWLGPPGSQQCGSKLGRQEWGRALEFFLHPFFSLESGIVALLSSECGSEWAPIPSRFGPQSRILPSLVPVPLSPGEGGAQSVFVPMEGMVSFKCHRCSGASR